MDTIGEYSDGTYCLPIGFWLSFTHSCIYSMAGTIHVKEANAFDNQLQVSEQ